MKYLSTAYLLCAFSLTILSAENPWTLYKEFPQDKTKIRAAYFNNAGNAIYISTQSMGLIIDLPSSTIKHRMPALDGYIFSPNETEEFIITNMPSGHTITVRYHSNTQQPKHIDFESCLPITPHRCKTHINPIDNQEIASLTYEPEPKNHMSNGLIIRDVFTTEDIENCYQPHKVVDLCFHPTRNIIASVTAVPNPTLFILHAGKFHRFYTHEYPQELHSIRFDETGNRLIVVNEEFIEILDTSDINNIKLVGFFNNSGHAKQACVSGNYLAMALSSSIKLIDIRTQSTIMECAGYNNDSSPMNCFDNTGNLFMIFKDNKVSIYKKTEKPSLDRDLDDASWYHDCNRIEKMVASICVFLHNNFFGC